MTEQKQRRRQQNMKVTLTTCWAGPMGVARPGTVLNVPEDKAQELVQSRQARQYDEKRDRKAPVGFMDTKPK